MKTYAYGFPRLGIKREYKYLLESFWDKKIVEQDLVNGIVAIDKSRKEFYKGKVDENLSGDMSYYDPMLDMALLIGWHNADNFEDYYKLARGKDALEMTKWLNTNYHYLVPDIERFSGEFKLSEKWLNEKKKFVAQGERVYIVGPFTFLKLAKIPFEKIEELKDGLLSVYKELYNIFPKLHIDEPAFVLELEDREWGWIKDFYSKWLDKNSDTYLMTYYDGVSNGKVVFDLPVKAIGLDFIHGSVNWELLKNFPEDKVLLAGLIDGRNIWKIKKDVVEKFENEAKHLNSEIIITNAAPLYHLPVTTENENLPEFLLERLAFAKEKMEQFFLVGDFLDGKKEGLNSWLTFKDAGDIVNDEIQKRVASLKEDDFVRSPSYAERDEVQRKHFNFPLFPTTTIGSFPQTPDVRKMRADFKNKRISSEEYDNYVHGKIDELIAFQEEIGLDVLVHGEFERSDMVEFFATKLNGIATTLNGWIISYGSRGYRPPIIYGDISRPEPMTVKEIAYAQSKTKKQVKGMLTGPVTIIAWSFVRDDVSEEQVAYQLGLALADELKDYEDNGIEVIQVDEPAIRERAPIKKEDWKEYFQWAVKSFKLVHSKIKPETQLHTHMCYSEFGEIIDYILELDFDVISIEATRSRGDILESFESVNFDRQIGLGVWDIHSPAVPEVDEMVSVIERALKEIPQKQFWINPDCGLKTRRWEEVKLSLKNLMSATEVVRKKYGE